MSKFLNHHGVVIENGETVVRWHEVESHYVTMDNLLLTLCLLLSRIIEILEPISRTKWAVITQCVHICQILRTMCNILWIPHMLDWASQSPLFCSVGDHRVWALFRGRCCLSSPGSPLSQHFLMAQYVVPTELLQSTLACLTINSCTLCVKLGFWVPPPPHPIFPLLESLTWSKLWL